MKAGETKQGTRLHEMKDDWSDLVEGCYYKLPNGDWAIHPPGTTCFGHLSPQIHTITEHEDGTITVSPSILMKYGDGKEEWHGYLERGIWRRV